MKIVKKENAKHFKYADTSSVLEYSIDLNERNLDFCINTITGRYPEKGYCSNLACEELCYVLDGTGHIYKKERGNEKNNGEIIIRNCNSCKRKRKR